MYVLQGNQFGFNIHYTEIYPVYSIIHLSNNWAWFRWMGGGRGGKGVLMLATID